MIHIICALLVAASTALTGQNASEKPKPSSIEGVVTRIGTGEPLSGVRVTVTPEPGGLSSTATTNAQGRFTILNLQPGRYTVDVARTLFVRPPRSADSLIVTLGADQHVRDLNIQLTPTAVITGRIFDENRQPLRAVRVEAVRYQYREGWRILTSSGQAQSDDRGEYRIFNLQPDTYYLRVSRPSNAFQGTLAAIYYPGVVDPQDAVGIKVDSGAEINAIDVSLTARRTVSVRVRLVGALPLIPSPSPVFFAVRHDRLVPDLMTLQSEPAGGGHVPAVLISSRRLRHLCSAPFTCSATASRSKRTDHGERRQ